MDRRFSLLLFFLLGVSSARANSRPNVLFLAVDDMNDWIGCLETTPRAADGSDNRTEFAKRRQNRHRQGARGTRWWGTGMPVRRRARHAIGATAVVYPRVAFSGSRDQRSDYSGLSR